MLQRSFKSKIILKVKDIKIIRIILYPFINCIRILHLKKYRTSYDASKIRGLKDKYRGKRCFIIGNGPSLTLNDLEALKNEFTFGANKIYTLFDKTEWRPNAYVCVDREALRNGHETIEKIKGQYKFIEQYGKKYFKGTKKNIYYCYSYAPFNIRYAINPIFSDDISNGMWSGQTVTFSAMQIAVYMGFKEIYLIGVDHHYRKTINEKGQITVDSTVQDYSSLIDDGGLGIQYIDGVSKAYKSAYIFCKEKGITIKNATRGGKLEIFDRVNLEDILQDK